VVVVVVTVVVVVVVVVAIVVVVTAVIIVVVVVTIRINRGNANYISRFCNQTPLHVGNTLKKSRISTEIKPEKYSHPDAVYVVTRSSVSEKLTAAIFVTEYRRSGFKPFRT
jgi:hypothetical protein